jgi:DNA-directed RNA polymerase subunit beta
MDKSTMHPQKFGKTVRMSFQHQKNILDMPNLIEVQKQSFDSFITEGIQEVLHDMSPIQDYNGNLELWFDEFKLREDKKTYDIDECRDRDLTYSIPLYIKARLEKKDTGEIVDEDVYLCDMPMMTETGTFVINGAERVIVSQLVRSPGIYYDIQKDKYGKVNLYSCTVIPNRGAWIEYETDSNNCFYAKVDRNKKVPVTVLLRILGLETNQEILETFGDEPKLKATMEKDPSNSERTAVLELYKKLRPGEPLDYDQAKRLIDGMLFDQRRYDLAHVGRFQYNKKLSLRRRIAGHVLAEDVIDADGVVLARAGETLTREMADEIQDAAIPSVVLDVEWHNGGQLEKRHVKVLSNMMVAIDKYLPLTDEEKSLAGVTEPRVYYPKLMEFVNRQNDGEFETREDLLKAIHKDINELIPKHITPEDILASVNYNIHLEYGVGYKDDIDHLGNRRIRCVGELLENQFRVGMTRMERVVKERMSTADTSSMTPRSLINPKPVTGVFREFFGGSQLSQFMDQNNPLSELTNKRRLSAVGPGGLSRDRAGFEVRDVHYTHYGRMCPVETPEGPNIGLINSLACYAKINRYGFIEAPYRLVDKSDPDNPRVTDEVRYFSADEEDDYHVAQANAKIDDNGYFMTNTVSGRYREETAAYDKRMIDLMDVSPRMVFSVATSMIPFLQNDDANRALMGSNMQRQAVPLLTTEAPVIATGIEHKAAVDSGVCVVAKEDGVVKSSESNRIVIVDKDGNEHEYKLYKFMRTNASNCYNQRPIVFKGDEVKKGDVIADGPSTSNGEIALGKNPLIGFMTWEGYNYEDAVLLSERLVRDDVYTSIHIEEYTCNARETKLGPDEITNDIDVSESELRNLDENGIVRIGAEVRAGDILVGKVTPKGETELTPEQKLLQAVFSDKAKDVRDTSLRLPHGAYGIVVDVKQYSRSEKNSPLPAGVNESVTVFVAQKRKISVGDKMAGRHGNKGVVSRILPVEDMPFLPNGRPLDIVLNPLGVPSRMNIGQVLEIHLSLAAKILGFNVSSPIFDGASEKDIRDLLKMANSYANDTWEDFTAKYKDKLSDVVFDYLDKNKAHREEWKGVPINEDGTVQLRDGRSGECFDGRTTIGFMHYLKLHHLVDDKIHARSTGPYSLVTQQPLGGKAQFGGQRFGEMEVWALEAYGAAYTLEEIMTVKSDDIVGRVKTYEAIVKGENIPAPGIPESFKVLIKELQALALDVRILDKNNNEVKMLESDQYENTSYNKIFTDDHRGGENRIDASDLKSGVSVGELNAEGGIDETAQEPQQPDDADLYDDDDDDFVGGSVEDTPDSEE